MRRIAITVAIFVVLLWGLNQVRSRLGLFENMKAGVIETSAPVSVDVARIRCPIPLPDSATNIQYVVWSLWRSSQTFVRFEAPVSDCLQHAITLLQGNSGIIVQTNITGPLVMPFVLSRKDVNITWFDLPKFSAGVSFGMTNAHAPKISVDTNRGCFYYELND